MQAAEDQSIKIASPDRVARILHRIVQVGLPLILRQPQAPDVSVKGKASRIVQENGQQNLRITDISDKGIMHISASGTRQVLVEFALSSSKLVFTAPIIAREANSLVVRFPTELTSIERRKNARHMMTEDMCAFIRFEQWKTDSSDMASQPVLSAYADQADMFALGDVSNGGISVATRFPAVLNFLKRGAVIQKAALHFPMQPPVYVTIEVRWCKKIKESITDDRGYVRQARHYKFGLEFRDLGEETNIKIKQFIQLLNQSSAI